MNGRQMARIKSRPGLFGTIIHYDAKEHKECTDPGLLGTQKYRNERGRQVGKSTPGIWGMTETESEIEISSAVMALFFETKLILVWRILIIY